MNAIESELPGVLILEPRVFADERGFFLELSNRRTLAGVGIEEDFVQDNLSRSRRGTLRGLHFQIAQPQGKLVACLSGRVLDVAVDLRRSSPSYGRHTAIELDAESHRMVYLPPGFAHGFCVLSETADFFYKCTDYYAPQSERTLLWNDPALGIDWPLDALGQELTLSAKDRAGTTLAEIETYD